MMPVDCLFILWGRRRMILIELETTGLLNQKDKLKPVHSKQVIVFSSKIDLHRNWLQAFHLPDLFVLLISLHYNYSKMFHAIISPNKELWTKHL